MIEGGQVFLRAWVASARKNRADVREAEWSALPAWERASANAVYDLVRAFVEAGGTDGLSRVHKGRFAALCWSAQAHRHNAAPVADWERLPAWQRDAYAEVFEHIEQLILGTR
ncbi:hypothetical protein JOD54_001845 [Actinokineospora baliensis]|uniref:hypothetical protein n=1 Tax=Actinokineospora baliensis TaxID=547056 RepID=UPI00195A0298|nr:hypothetical protein [Actinokineospora baliensis]MBM7771641.1 hypothetical protein [Actinokineospora baliensis]